MVSFPLPSLKYNLTLSFPGFLPLRPFKILYCFIAILLTKDKLLSKNLRSAVKEFWSVVRKLSKYLLLFLVGWLTIDFVSIRLSCRKFCWCTFSIVMLFPFSVRIYSSLANPVLQWWSLKMRKTFQAFPELFLRTIFYWQYFVYLLEWYPTPVRRFSTRKCKPRVGQGHFF